ncbi:hypothetical protein KSP39_PZI004647 [Platanthera zijinensis]|uniref:Uncharacterized protein n=1 Tax=Platanthera zijinensis TaxID=2320716 RepID=A0AAP0BVR0_9ASPA
MSFLVHAEPSNTLPQREPSSDTMLNHHTHFPFQNPGLGDNTPPTSKDGEANKPSKSSGGTGGATLLVLLGVAAFVAVTVFMFKLWQKKKRQEQYARLLKLFEEDDELELELGLRD